MVASIQVRRVRVKGGLRVLALCLIPATAGISGCSSLPDAINPVSWWGWVESQDEGFGDSPAEAAAEAPTDRSKPVASGASMLTASGELVGDERNAAYGAAVSRDGTVTKPVAPKTAAMADGKGVAMAADSSAPTARMQGTQLPANTASPPPRPDVPDSVPVHGKGTQAVMDQYHRRLGETATGPSAAALQQPWAVHLTPPKLDRGSASVAAGSTSSTFQLASLSLNGSGGGLTPSDEEALREAVRLRRQTGGVLRIVGLSAPFAGRSGTILISSASSGSGTAFGTPMSHADLVARELVRLGVPGSQILVGAVAPNAPPAADGALARLYLDM